MGTYPGHIIQARYFLSDLVPHTLQCSEQQCISLFLHRWLWVEVCLNANALHWVATFTPAGRGQNACMLTLSACILQREHFVRENFHKRYTQLATCVLHVPQVFCRISANENRQQKFLTHCTVCLTYKSCFFVFSSTFVIIKATSGLLPLRLPGRQG